MVVWGKAGDALCQSMTGMDPIDWISRFESSFTVTDSVTRVGEKPYQGHCNDQHPGKIPGEGGNGDMRVSCK